MNGSPSSLLPACVFGWCSVEGFLDQLYQLTRATKRVPREDFVSLCLGRQLERDRRLTRFLVDRVLGQHGRLGSWSAPRSWNGRVEVQTQVTVWLAEEDRAVRADVVLCLLGVAQSALLVLEAKVGDDEPSEEQLDSYRTAFPGALVVSLVERRRAGRCPTSSPVLTWDDVLEGLAAGSKAQRASRRDLRDLMLRAQVGDARLALEADAWNRADQLMKRFPRLKEKLEAVLVALGPNNAIRTKLERSLQRKKLRCDPSEGWGPGLWFNSSLPGTAIQGLCLSIDAGSAAQRVRWKLEIYANKALARALRNETTPWRRAAGEKRWYILDILTSDGNRTLRKADFAAALAHGRSALRQLHRLTPDRAWNTRGAASSPHAPRLHIPELRRGIRAWSPVSRALYRSVSEILLRLVGRDEAGRRRFQWTEGGWLTRTGVLPHSARLRARVDEDLAALRFNIEGPTGLRDERWARATAAWGVDGPTPRLDDTAVLVVLGPENWNHPHLVEQTESLLRTAVGAPQ